MPADSLAAARVLALALARAAREHKGEDLRILQVGEVLHLTDYFLLVTTGSVRQTRTLGHALDEAARTLGRPKARVEGGPDSPWVLLDYGPVVVHVFTAEAREFYALDRLWADVPEVPVQDDGGEEGAA